MQIFYDKLRVDVSALLLAQQAALAAGAAAAEAGKLKLPPYQPFSSRLAAQAADIQPDIEYLTVGDLRYVRDPAGTALTTADGAKWSPAGVPTPQHFGAVGDGITDDGAAINAMVAFTRDFITSEAGWETVSKTMCIPSGRYRTTVSLNFTSLRSYNTTIEAYGATIIGECHDKTVVDLLDTRFLKWKGGTIIGSNVAGKRPHAGMVIGRRSDNRVADTISITDLQIVGNFKGACFGNLEAETFTATKCVFHNTMPSFPSCAVALDAKNAMGFVSDYVTPSAVPISANLSHFFGCDFKTFDSDGVSRGAGYAVRIITDYTDGAAWRDVLFDEYYANATSAPGAVQHTDYNVAIFYVDGYVHNLTITGRGEREGYLDAILRVKNTTNAARIKGLKMREHFMAGKAGLVQAEGSSYPVHITGADLSATVSQEGMRASPLASPHGTIFGPASDRTGNGQLYVTGVVNVPADSGQNYILNDFSGCARFNGTIYSSAPWDKIVGPQSGSYKIVTNGRTYYDGANVFDASDPAAGKIFIVRGGGIGMSLLKKADLPAAEDFGEGFAIIKDPAAGKSNMVLSDATTWRYTDGTAV